MATNKTCLGALTTNLLVSCKVPQHGIAEMVIVPFEKILSFTVEPTGNQVSAISYPLDTKTILVETFKLTAQATESLRVLDCGAGLAQTVTFTIYDKTLYGTTVSGLANRKFFVLAKFKETGLYKIYGVRQGLEMSSADSDSNADGGYFKLALSTPEGSQGEASFTVAKSVYDTLLAKRV